MDTSTAIAEFLETQEYQSAVLRAKVLGYFQEWFQSHTGETFAIPQWTIQDTRAWILYLTHNKGLSEATVNAYRSSLSAFAKWCVEEGVLDRNPVKAVKGRTAVHRNPEALTRNEEHALLRALRLKNLQHQAVVLLILHTGVRCSELIGIRLSHVTMGKDEVTLDQLPTLDPKNYRSGMLQVIDGKGHKDRQIPLNETARAAILRYLAKRPETDSRQLFISLKTKMPLGPDGVREICRQHSDLLRRRLHPHMLRRTFATRLIQQGVPLEVVADLLGHEDINVTRQNYVETQPGGLLRAVLSIDGGTDVL
jgi:site-specific recombinase XerD